MSRPAEETYVPAPPRFQIASRLGAFRDTAQIRDPFGTGAIFTIYRSGSNAHRAWFRTRIDDDPLTLVMTESMLSDDTIPLTDEESETLLSERAKDNPLVPVVDRLSSSHAERDRRKEATRTLIREGKLKPSDMNTRGEESMLAEALFTLRHWDKMPAEDGTEIPYSTDAARDLLTNDTPLEGAGIDDLILAVDAWTIEIKEERDEPYDVPFNNDLEEVKVVNHLESKYVYKIRVIIPGLTLGRAYQLYLLNRSRDVTLFRDLVLGAAAKNSEPSSGSTSLPGDGNETSSTAN